ncbi:hypothetical protein EVAR_76663_1 [Eumeta japonica]|uniref:Uncharacterized protein n=1 Tax=Eumeta variegata TaxID=151549 RepID=A0A4C1YD88_EUMVA|nr:hypothetical protein EVAR_76663_1 [Eumeta japonica]
MDAVKCISDSLVPVGPPTARYTKFEPHGLQLGWVNYQDGTFVPRKDYHNSASEFLKTHCAGAELGLGVLISSAKIRVIGRYTQNANIALLFDDMYTFPISSFLKKSALLIVIYLRFDSFGKGSLKVGAATRSSRSRQNGVKSGQVALMACTLQMHQKNHISRGCASISLHISQIGSRSVKQCFIFHLQVGRTAECLPEDVASYQCIVGSCTYCYQCISSSDPTCGESYSSKKPSKDCSKLVEFNSFNTMNLYNFDPELTQPVADKPRYCHKIITQNGLVIRSCFDGNPADKNATCARLDRRGRESSDPSRQLKYCSVCDKDNCNGADAPIASLSLALAAAVLAYFSPRKLRTVKDHCPVTNAVETHRTNGVTYFPKHGACNQLCEHLGSLGRPEKNRADLTVSLKRLAVTS